MIQEPIAVQELSDCAVVCADPYGPELIRNRFELQRRVPGIRSPKTVVLVRQALGVDG